MRLQLHRGFTFSNAADLAPYLADLGVSHVYSSPILTARAGSMHGYDVVDPTTINPELGGEAGFRDLVARLRGHGLGLIVDIVPNHMAVGGSDNSWWNDLMRYGRGSAHADFFDVNWESEDAELRGKLLAPFLGRPYGEALEAGEIQLGLSPIGEPLIRYFDNEFPINPAHYGHICDTGTESFDHTTSAGRGHLHNLLERQHYRLAWWGTAGDEINWRRFFDINSLAGLRVELPHVFEATHATLFHLYGDGLIDGFRIDHVDGLSDPPGYCRRLRQRLREIRPDKHAYIVVEKILGPGEALPTDWEIEGTSGYDFMNGVSALQHDPCSADRLARLWNKKTNRSPDFESEAFAARAEILKRGFDSQLRSVVSALHRIARSNPETRDVPAAAIRRAVVGLLTYLPVYRGYGAPSSHPAYAGALSKAKASAPTAAHSVLDRVGEWLNDEVAGTRFNQLSAPVAAKAIEDTAFYRYGRLLSRNDVGFDPNRFGASVAEFHADCACRLATFPHAMLATATHDHKRGEDVRARLAVISEIPDEWSDFLERCPSGPDPMASIMLLQSIVGAWPTTLDPADRAGCQAFRKRLAVWQQKALREAKLRTDWVAPNENFEAKQADFLRSLFEPTGAFLPVVKAFVDRIAPAGAVNGLAQIVLKMTAPGIPDFFQGTEFWDFSLVDPDNRRPVDFRPRRAALEAIPEGGAWRDGHVKLAVIRHILKVRRQFPEVFADGDYQPLELTEAANGHFVAFARSLGDVTVLVVVPRLVQSGLMADDRIDLTSQFIGGAAVLLPKRLHGMELRSALWDGRTFSGGSAIRATDLFAPAPVAILFRNG